MSDSKLDINPFVPPNFREELKDYLTEIIKRKNEYDKRAYFKSKVLEGWLKISPDLIYFEKDRKDLYYAGILFETKSELSDAKRKVAFEELKNYIEDLLKKGGNVFKVIITDGV
ncbi:MAG: hypothetical protein ARM1_0635 [Candidatus Micrarchaeota archaeon]|nr:MAG: hypothetical protein ARM1_0635 [Candidatus Micrarchaeota archaeon]